MALGQHHLHAVGQRGALDGGELQIGEGGGLRDAGAAVDVGLHRLELRVDLRGGGRRSGRCREHGFRQGRGRGFAGLHEDGVRRASQPLLRGRLHVGRGRVGEDVQLFLVAVRRALVDGARGQHVGLAAETADALDAAHECRATGHLGAFQFVGGGAFGDQALEFFVQRLLHLGRVHAFLHGRDQEEGAADLAAPLVGAGLVGDLVAVHQAGVEARGRAAA